jgi:Tol biopolymer transport system component
LLTRSVSPDGHYLAYCVFYSLNVPIIPGSGWVQYLYLKNLNSGRVVRIASRFRLSNLVWSSDSRRLCFAGIRSPDWLGLLPHTGGVYVVDVHDVF